MDGDMVVNLVRIILERRQSTSLADVELSIYDQFERHAGNIVVLHDTIRC